MTSTTKLLMKDLGRVAFRVVIALLPVVVLGATVPQVQAEHIQAAQSIFTTVVNSGALGILAAFYVIEIAVREWNRYQDRIAARERAKVMAQREREYKESTATLYFILQAFVDVVNRNHPDVAAEVAKRTVNGGEKGTTQQIGIHVR